MMIQSPVGWLDGTGEYPGIVISSRVRLARNLKGIPFSHRASREQLEEVQLQLRNAQGENKFLKNAIFLDTSELTDIDKQFMVERNLVSPDFLEKKGARGLLVGEKEIVSIMINEEDHVRLQGLHSGFQPKDVWRIIDRIDDELSGSLEYAFSDEFGYLTACPTNTGTGLRASILIHLPALVLTQEIDKVLRGITQVGLAVRGFYGEGTAVLGNLFQISNQTTLGQSEEDIINSLERVTKQIIEFEQNARKTLLKDAQPQIEDKIWRAYGIVKNARVLTSQEFMNLSSAIRLGVAMGMIPDVTVQTINQLMIETQPSHLQKRAGKKMEPAERDIYRADFVRKILSG
ncbi:MAG: protein arginine kinase [Gemmatimonadota bacterium]|nr:MAG: protein arginine kinase [Gemmatimonadota bacterium]